MHVLWHASFRALLQATWLPCQHTDARSALHHIAAVGFLVVGAEAGRGRGGRLLVQVRVRLLVCRLPDSRWVGGRPIVTRSYGSLPGRLPRIIPVRTC